MIDLTLSSDDEMPPKRRRVSPQGPPPNQLQDGVAAPCRGPSRPSEAAAPAAARNDASLTQPGTKASSSLAQEPQPVPQHGVPAFGPADDDDDRKQVRHAGAWVREEEDDEDAAPYFGLGGLGGWRDAPAGLGGTQRGARAGGLRDIGPGDPGGAGAGLIGNAGGNSPDDAGADELKKKRGGGGKRLTAEEREERERAKAEAKAAREAERARLKEEKAARKVAEAERKAAEKDANKRAKDAQKEAAKLQKESGNALKATMVIRHLRMLMSNSLAASPLGTKLMELAPVFRNKDQTYAHELHRNLPLAARGYRYCMWGVRLPAPAAAKLQAAEGCALEATDLEDPEGSGKPLLLFPALMVVLSGDELLSRLEADPTTPLAGLYGDVVRAHPGSSLMVYVTGFEEALRRRERANKSFSRAAIEDLLFDVTVGMPAVRLQYDCPDSDLARAATDILNLGFALSQQPRKRLDAYLEHFGSKTTLPLRTIKEVLGQQGGAEELTLCDALSQLIPPQRAAAMAAEYPSLAAIMEALRARPEGAARNGMLARCRIPGVVPGKQKQQFAGPAASASVARFLQIHNGRDEWKDVAED